MKTTSIIALNKAQTKSVNIYFYNGKKYISMYI
jgi:hypothetical protein